jgi:TMEM175 potassium channel family protein
MTTNRLEAFSDGVFAIAITLLVLEIHVPEQPEQGLAKALLEQWPTYASYIVSFFVIGIIWINHHAVFDHLVRVDRALLFLNLLLLFWIALLPWPTNVLGTYMREGGADERVAAVLYTGVMTLMGASFGGLWSYASRHRWLLGDSLSTEEIRARTRRSMIGTPVYALAMLVGLVSAAACLVINALLAVYYALPAGGALPHRRVD